MECEMAFQGELAKNLSHCCVAADEIPRYWWPNMGQQKAFMGGSVLLHNQHTLKTHWRSCYSKQLNNMVTQGQLKITATKFCGHHSTLMMCIILPSTWWQLPC